KEIGDKFYFGAAAPTAGSHWFHPGTLGWNPAWKPDAYDPARAKKLLADAGYPNGFTIPVRLFTMPGTTELPALGEAVAGYWEKIGVRADLIRTEWVVHRPDLVKRAFKGATIYRGFPQVEPVTVWRLAYHSKGDFGEREDPFVDAVLDTLAATVNAEEREALAKKLGDFLVTDFATLPMVSASYLYGTNPKTVKAWQPTRGKYPDHFEWLVPSRWAAAARRPALTMVMERLPLTLELGTTAFLVSLVIAVPIGVISAVRRDTSVDVLGKVIALLGQSFPTFWLGLMLILLFAVTLEWLPAS